MSTSRGSGDGTGVQPIPAASRKMIQSLKEVVNCSEAEIYATLRECNMDPNEAVNRLLSQDPFHEVKSKREKKKEGKDTYESRHRGANNSSNRGSKSGADRYSDRGGLTPYNSSESATVHGRPTYNKENGATPYSSSSPSVPSFSGNNRSRGTAGFSDDTSAENNGTSWGTADGMPSSVQPPLASHSAWVGATPGQMSMADIVKMGRPQNKVVNAPNGSHNNGHEESGFPDDHASKYDEWPSIEQPVASISESIPGSTVDPHVCSEETDVRFDRKNQDYESEEDQETDDDVETSAVNDVELESHSFSSRKFLDDDSRGGPMFENDLYKNTGSYLPQANDFQRHEVEGGASVSSVARNLEQLSVLEKDDRVLASEGDDDAPCVIIPDHLKVQNPNCSLLSFGNFRSGMSLPYSSGAAAPLPVETNLGERQTEVDVPSLGHADASDSEYYGDDSFRNGAGGTLYHRTSSSVGRHDVASSASQREQHLKPEHAEVQQYPFQSSNPAGYSFDNSSQLLNAAFSQANAEIQQNQSSFSNAMQSYPSSLPSTLLAANVQQHSREAEQQQHQYSPLNITPAMAAKYGISASAFGGSTISLSEALKTAGMSPVQPVPQNPLPQQLSLHPYSQQAHPMGSYASMIGYPFLPQSYAAHMPSAFQQQTIANNSVYHQSLAAAAALPQYKNNVSASNVHQSAAIASGYGGGLGSGAGALSGSFQMNPPAAMSGTSLSYDDVLSSQYKDNNSHLISLQQNENSSMWPNGSNSRTMSGVPSGTYYNNNYKVQTQQPSGFRQTRQTSPNYGALGYPNDFYHSQPSMAQDQPQNPRSGSLGQPKQSQIWQNSY